MTGIRMWGISEEGSVGNGSDPSLYLDNQRGRFISLLRNITSDSLINVKQTVADHVARSRPRSVQTDSSGHRKLAGKCVIELQICLAMQMCVFEYYLGRIFLGEVCLTCLVGPAQQLAEGVNMVGSGLFGGTFWAFSSVLCWEDLFDISVSLILA